MTPVTPKKCNNYLVQLSVVSITFIWAYIVINKRLALCLFSLLIGPTHYNIFRMHVQLKYTQQ